MSALTRNLSILVTACLLGGCAAAVKMTAPKNLATIRESTITVVARGEDPEGIRGLIEQVLLEKGYNVVSEEVA